MIGRVCVACVVWFVCISLGGAALAQEDPGGTLDERLARFDEKTREIEDLTARFEQRKHSILLREPMVSRGRVRVKGEAIRWETREPVESVIRVDERDARIYYPDQKLMEVYALGADLRFLAGSPVPRLSALREHFDIRSADASGLDEKMTSLASGLTGGLAGALTVSLTPREEPLKSRIERIRLVLDEEVGVMRLFELTDAHGDRTVIVFERIETNRGLTDADVALETPAGTRISRPLGGEDEGTKGEGADKSEGGDDGGGGS